MYNVKEVIIKESYCRSPIFWNIKLVYTTSYSLKYLRKDGSIAKTFSEKINHRCRYNTYRYARQIAKIYYPNIKIKVIRTSK